MTFLAIDSQKMLLTMQRNQLQFEQTCVMREASRLAKEMNMYMNEMESDSNWDPDLDADYQYYEIMDEYLESRQDSLDSEIQLLDTNISSLKTMVNNNIKNSCALNLAGS